MCLAVPGKIEEILVEDELLRAGRVSFGTLTKEVSLACVPEARAGDYVLVHAGLAISTLDAAEAARALQYFAEIDEIEDAMRPEP
jgi:hydrogenase expression/formation protein HypC